MKGTLVTAVLTVVVAAGTGCEKWADAQPKTAEKASKGPPDAASDQTAKRIQDGLKAVEHRPSFRSAEDDPEAVNARQRTQSLEEAMRSVHGRLNALRLALDGKELTGEEKAELVEKLESLTNEDLRKLVAELRSLMKDARAGCDDMIRRVEDFVQAAPSAGASYLALARGNRAKAAATADPAARVLLERLAGEMEWVGNDVPRRVEAAQSLLGEMRKTRLALAETAEALARAAANLEALGAGPRDTSVGSDVAVFTYVNVRRFIRLVERYAEELRPRPVPPRPVPPPKPVEPGVSKPFTPERSNPE